MNINENEMIESYDMYVEGIQNKNWCELTTDELQLIKDPKKKIEYRKKIRLCIKCLINPLYDSIQNRGKFKFSVSNKNLTCQIMVRELVDYYKKLGFDKEKIINIAYEADSTKKY